MLLFRCQQPIQKKKNSEQQQHQHSIDEWWQQRQWCIHCPFHSIFVSTAFFFFRSSKAKRRHSVRWNYVFIIIIRTQRNKLRIGNEKRRIENSLYVIRFSLSSVAGPAAAASAHLRSGDRRGGWSFVVDFSYLVVAFVVDLFIIIIYRLLASISIWRFHCMGSRRFNANLFEQLFRWHFESGQNHK